VYAQIARIAKATANPVRLEILELLAQGPRTVDVLAGQIGQSLANTSHHLQVLRGARLVDAEKAGLYVTYRLADDTVAAFVLNLRTLARARLAEIEQISRAYVRKPGGLEPVDDDELLRRVKAGEVTVLDVRPTEEYAAGHIPHAISVPVPELKRRLRELPRDRDVVAYCRGPYCVMAVEAVDILRAKGFRAHHMAHGVTEWRASGGRLLTGPAPVTRRGIRRNRHG
jgi:rhodanese-related sulfurtransferase/DNA-binding transcriptional ArsR family regulator